MVPAMVANKHATLLFGSSPARNDETSPLWSVLVAEAQKTVTAEPILSRLLDRHIFAHDNLESALASCLAQKLENYDIDACRLQALVLEAIAEEPAILQAATTDLRVSYERNPAYEDHLTPFVYFKGFQALQWHRIGHWLWARGRRALAIWLQSGVSEVLGLDIHPAAQIGAGIFVDHGTGIVIGETAVVENHVSLLHEVTLGGTGKQKGDRHPKVHRGVLIGAGAKVLGNVQIGEGARIGAASVVLHDVPPYATAVGVPARVIPRKDRQLPALSMNHFIDDELIDA
jgi:serine O-acetyltransferase